MKKFFDVLKRGWIGFGNFLGTVNGYIIMTLIYFLVIGPISLFLRLFRVDVLMKKRPAETNWQPVDISAKDPDFYRRLS